MNAIIKSDCTKRCQLNKSIKTFFESCSNNATVDVLESCSSSIDSVVLSKIHLQLTFHLNLPIIVI